MAVWDFSIAIGVILLSFVLAYIGFKIEEGHPFLKIFFISMSIFSLVVGNASMPVILSINKVTNAVIIQRVDLAYKIISFSLMFTLTYMIVFFLVLIMRGIREKLEVRKLR